MKYIIPLISALFFTGSFNAVAQSCNCREQLLFAKDKIEHNYAGFNDKVNNQTRQAYQKATAAALRQADTVHQQAHCVAVIDQWLAFFKDGHVNIGRNRVSAEKESADLQKRIAQLETIPLSEAALSALRDPKGVEGIYTDEGKILRIAIIRSPNAYRTYAGIVLQGKAPFMPGQVIMELKEKLRDTVSGLVYDRYFIPEPGKLKVTAQSIGTWQRERTAVSLAKAAATKEVDFQQLNATTNYLKIGSFNQRNAVAIDSVIRNNANSLGQSPYLIVDLRNNGGGSDFTYQPVLPYLYTGPFRSYGVEVLASRNNIEGWATLLTMKDIPEAQKGFVKGLIAKMEAHPDQFISLKETSTVTMDSVSAYPRKIVMLVDGNCGSTTEEFLLTARQSSKVILMGKPTAGVLDYANVRGADFSGIPYTLYWATSRSSRIPLGKGIDTIGIQPDQLLSDQVNWIEQAQSFLER